MRGRAYKFATTRNRGFRRPKAGATSPASRGGLSCTNLNDKSSSEPAQVIAVSRAISLPVTLSNGREKPTTETKDTIRKCGNQSRGKSNETARPNCYQCKYRGEIPGNAHSKCLHPSIKHISADPMFELIGMLGSRGISKFGLNLGREEILNPGRNPLGVAGHQHGVESGWFNWPINYDPAWLLSCAGFEEKAA